MNRVIAFDKKASFTGATGNRALPSSEQRNPILKEKRHSPWLVPSTKMERGLSQPYKRERDRPATAKPSERLPYREHLLRLKQIKEPVGILGTEIESFSVQQIVPQPGVVSKTPKQQTSSLDQLATKNSEPSAYVADTSSGPTPFSPVTGSHFGQRNFNEELEESTELRESSCFNAAHNGRSSDMMPIAPVDLKRPST